VIFDYYFTLADPRPTSETTLTALLSSLQPPVSRETFDQERTALLATHQGKQHGPTSQDDPAEFQTFHDEWLAFGDALFARFGVKGGGRHYARARWEAHATAPLFPASAATLSELTDAGYRLGVLSDADEYLHENLARHQLRFDAVITSQDLRCYKPHRRLFEQACRAMDVPASSAVYVGDGPETDVEGARRAGLDAIWVDRGVAPWPPALAPPPRTITSLDGLAGVVAKLAS
jgi:2-haloalkanoic acid dehalogenase type II